MKKLIILLLLAGLAGCSKSGSTSANTTVQYQFTASANSTWLITYTDANDNPVQTSYTGTTWAKTISTNRAMGFKWATFTITTNTLASIPAVAKIIVGTQAANEQDYTFDQGNASIVFHTVVFN